MTDVIPEPDPSIVLEIARKHIRSGRGSELSTTIVRHFGNGTLRAKEFEAWHVAVDKAWWEALRTLSWPDEKPAAEPDLSGWSAEENAEFEKMYGVQAAMRLRAANNRVWAIVQELRSEAAKAGRDPYRDPMAQRLSAALVGADGPGCLCPHTYQPDGRLVRDGVLAAGCPVHDPDAGGAR